MSRDLAVALLSGGMDSCVCAAIAAQEHELALLHVSYGQRTAARERRAFRGIADIWGVEQRLECSLDHLRQIGGSSLTDPSRPVIKDGLDSGPGGIPTSYVPFRNAHFLAIAVSWAEVIGAKNIYIGAVAADSSGYPDCRPEFYEAMNEAIRRGTREDSGIVVKAPFVALKKKDIVLMGKSMGVPFERSWSCYREGEAACGVCDSCALRLRAFAEAGVDDPLPYETRPDYR
jgi:7-cyano-7-deazaguanine synthase